MQINLTVAHPCEKLQDVGCIRNYTERKKSMLNAEFSLLFLEKIVASSKKNNFPVSIYLFSIIGYFAVFFLSHSSLHDNLLVFASLCFQLVTKEYLPQTPTLF